ncbi:MAG: calcium-binding protein [Aphanothece sp. CMT-3BRIN-NPC111]|nr:calcium-binding protein [Aphanothece sp. CMT-3BRIN-NPC111]
MKQLSKWTKTIAGLAVTLGSTVAISSVAYAAVINGTPGNDSKFGTNGNDTIKGLAGDDLLNGLGGSDLILGGNNNDTLFGFSANDVLNGEGGNDDLEGGTGIDAMTGGPGVDRFIYRRLGEGLDIITDFVPADDTIIVGTSFGGGIATGTLPANKFRIGSAAADADDRFIYNNATGDLFFDPDGTGVSGQVLVAALSANLAITNNDIVVVAT